MKSFKFLILSILSMGLTAQAQTIEGRYAREMKLETSWIKDGNAELYTRGFSLYNDGSVAAPVDGTGGSTSSFTISTTTTTPLEGKKSFVIGKAASNQQGYGISIPLTIDKAYANDANTIYFKWDNTTGTFVPGTDLKVYLYDITNSKLVNLTSNSLRTDTNGTYQEVFQATGSTSYRLIFHVASTSALAYNFRFDALKSYPGMVMGGIPQNTFTAKISASGTVTDETGGDWITGNCSKSGSFSEFGTCTISGFTSPPNCNIDITSAAAYSSVEWSSGYPTSTALQYYTFATAAGGATGGSSQPVVISCTKTGADYIQNTVSALNWNFDWTTCPAGVASSLGSSTISCKWKRQGGDAHFDITQSFTGTPGGGGLVYTMPTGVTIDSSKFSSASNSVEGEVTYYQPGTANYAGRIQYNDSTSVIARIFTITGDGYVRSNTSISNSVPVSTANGHSVQSVFRVPIAGWQETYNAIQLNGSVTSNSPSAVRVEWAYFAPGTACTSGTCAVADQSTPGLMSLTWTNTGRYTLTHNMGAGTYCRGPGSAVVVYNGGDNFPVALFSQTSTTVTLSSFLTGVGYSDAQDLMFTCYKKR